LTPDEILAAIRRWNELYGEPPSMTDWDPYRARERGQEWRIERYRSGCWPSVKSVRNHFGRLSNAIAAAGLVPREQGQRRARSELALDDETLAHLAYLRDLHARRPMEEVLSQAIRELAVARRSDEHGDLRSALIELAGAALAWARTVDDGVPERISGAAERVSGAAERVQQRLSAT
jgi:hypothetical protein